MTRKVDFRRPGHFPLPAARQISYAVTFGGCACRAVIALWTELGYRETEVVKTNNFILRYHYCYLLFHNSMYRKSIGDRYRFEFKFWLKYLPLGPNSGVRKLFVFSSVFIYVRTNL